MKVRLDAIEAQIDAIAHHAPALDAYRAWVREQGAPRGDYLFTAPRVRFEPRPGDVVVPHPGLTVEAEGDGAALVVADAGARLPVPTVPPTVVEALVAAMDGRCLLEVAWAVDEAALGALLRVGFGKVLFAAEAVKQLQKAVPFTEIVRFPVDPYAVERAYWDNMAAVRSRLPRLASARDAEAFWTELRRLHVVTLMGEQLDSFYRPASPGAARGFIAPGAFFLDPVRRRDGVEGAVVLLGGPRVRAKALGSDAYVSALEASLPEAHAEERGWGDVVVGRGSGDAAPQDWFLPPRPITPRHLELIHGAWCRRQEVEARAELHWRFVRLHPFACGNQSLVMALVNFARTELGAFGIPHLVLDHWALRLPLGRYTALFTRAEAAFASADIQVHIAQSARLQRGMGDDAPEALSAADRIAGLLCDSS